MLDHQTARGLRQGAHAAAALAAALVAALVLTAPAAAQLQIVPAATPAPPGADSPTLGGDAAHRNAWAGTGLRPPLEVAWQTGASPVHAAVAVGPRVVVQTGTALTALAAGDGATLWSRPLTDAAELATEGNRVYVTTTAGVAAVDLATGSTRWAVAEPGASGPVVEGGRLLVGNAAGQLVALAASTGAVLWRADVGIFRARPAVAGQRAYATGTCRAAAVELTLGLPVWSRGCPAAAATRTLLSGPAVIAEDGPIHRSSDGAPIAPSGGPGTVGAGLVFRSPITTPATSLLAGDAGTFAPRWSWSPPLAGSLSLRPAVVDGHVWQVAATDGDGLVLAALDALTGAERWTGFLPQPDGARLQAGTATAIAVAGGILLVPTAGGGLAALRNAPEGPLGVRATLPRNVVEAGARTTVTGQLLANGHGLTGPRAVTLQADRFPFEGRYARVGAQIATRDGFAFGARIPRNTRQRLRADGVTYRPTTVYAQPSLDVTYRRTPRPLVVRATLRIRREPGFRRAGRVGLYRLREGATTLVRIGTGRANRAGMARFSVRIPADLTESDRVVPCLRAGSRRGFGAPNVLDRACGERRIAIPAQSSSARPLSLSTATGSAMPLKRFGPASEKR